MRVRNLPNEEIVVIPSEARDLALEVLNTRAYIV